MNNEPEILRTIPRTTEISWEALEYEHKPVTPDWFWTVGFVSIVVAIISFYYGNLLFAIFALVSGLTIILFKIKGPQNILVRLTPKGIIIKNNLYPYGRIESFWIHEKERGDRIINELSIRSDRAFMPQIIIPLGEADAELVRDYLSKYLIEEYHEIQLADVLSEYLGF